MTGPAPEESLHPEIEAQFSESYERSLSADEQRAFEDHLADCDACRSAYDAFRETMSALSGLHKMSAPQAFEHEVAETIRRRSAGRFFGRRAFGDRIPYELIAIVMLALGLLIALLLRSSDTGSLRYETPPPAPDIAPGAKDVVPRPNPLP